MPLMLLTNIQGPSYNWSVALFECSSFWNMKYFVIIFLQVMARPLEPPVERLLAQTCVLVGCE